jgi:hypothetical protein
MWKVYDRPNPRAGHLFPMTRIQQNAVKLAKKEHSNLDKLLAERSKMRIRHQKEAEGLDQKINLSNAKLSSAFDLTEDADEQA